MSRTKKILINVVLLGHIDHGKTKLAEKLSQKISTAGLDKHPEAQRRGISIDIGFTAFELNEYLITLVDAPGHADLIRNVVAASSIADAAILVIAADEGSMIQTGEHIVILDSFKIHNVLIALNKIDLIKETEIPKRIDQIRNLLKTTSFPNAPIIPISAKNGNGIEELKKSLYSILSPPQRHIDGPLKMPIDHAFPIKGTGTVITGTIHRGTVSVGDKIEIMPLKIIAKIRGIQIFQEPIQIARAGDRVGLSIPGMDYRKISRGFYACSPNSLKLTHHLIIEGRINSLFKRIIKPGIRVHVTVGMPTVSAIIYPFKIENSKSILMEKVSSNEDFYAYLKLDKMISTEKGENILISRLELPPTTLRIVGNGKVIDPNPKDMEINKVSIRKGSVRYIKNQEDRVIRYVIDNLSKSKFGAEKLINKEIYSESGKIGRILSPFGTKGAVIGKFDQIPSKNQMVFLKKYKKVKL